MKKNSQINPRNNYIIIQGILIFILFSTGNAFSQLKYGLKAGLNLADVVQAVTISGQFTSENVTTNTGGSGGTTSTSTVENISQTVTVSTTPLISFYAGGYIEKVINKKQNLAVRVELLYARNGTNVDRREENLNTENILSYSSSGGKYIVHQLNLPILLKYTTNKKLAFMAGCYFGAVLAADAMGSNGQSFDLKARLKNYDFGLSVGASYPINNKFSVEFTYNRGIANLDPFKTTIAPFQVSSEFYTRALHFGLAYKLN